MAITKILNIKESKGRNPASHLENALQYIQNPDKTEKCILVGSINCLLDTAFEQMVETKKIFHKTGNRQGYHIIISFSPEENVSAEQAMYVIENFAKDVLGDDYEAVYAVHTDREHMHGHLIWNSVNMTTGKKYNSPKGNWKNHLQPITNKYCKELGLGVVPAEYSKSPKNISRDKWEKEMSMKEIILRDAKMCAYAAGDVEHFKYLMRSLGYIFKKGVWLEVQAPGFRYYHSLGKMDEMFLENNLKYNVATPWKVHPHYYSKNIHYLKRSNLSVFQKKYYAKMYWIRIIEQKRFKVNAVKYAEDLKRFHQLQDEYLMLVNNDIRDFSDLLDYRSEQEKKMKEIDDRQQEIYRRSSSKKRAIKTDEQYRDYQLWRLNVQKELDELKMQKKEVKKQMGLAEMTIKEKLYIASYEVSEEEELIEDEAIEIPQMKSSSFYSYADYLGNTDVDKAGMAGIDENNEVVAAYEKLNDLYKKMGHEVDIDILFEEAQRLQVAVKKNNVEDKSEIVARELLEYGPYRYLKTSVKADAFKFDVSDASGNMKLFMAVLGKLGVKLEGDRLYEGYQKIYEESVRRNEKEKIEHKKIYQK